MSQKLFKSVLLLAISIVGCDKPVYDLRFESFQKVIGDTETLMDFNLRLVGRHRFLNGTIINHVDMDDTFVFFSHIEGFMNGEWKNTSIGGRFKTCSFMKNIYGRYLESSMKDSNIPPGKEACPFKKGEYYMRNIELNTDDWATFAPRGLSKTQVYVRKNNKTYGGFIGIVEVKDHVN